MLRQVFVYGTLRRGGRNAGLMRTAQYLGPHITRPLFTLYDFGSFPGAVSGGSTAISGEVYRVSEKLLRRLDILEDVPNHYDRVIMQTPFGPTWIYLLVRRPSGARRVTHGDWMRFKGLSA